MSPFSPSLSLHSLLTVGNHLSSPLVSSFPPLYCSVASTILFPPWFYFLPQFPTSACLLSPLCFCVSGGCQVWDCVRGTEKALSLCVLKGGGGIHVTELSFVPLYPMRLSFKFLSYSFPLSFPCHLLSHLASRHGMRENWLNLIFPLIQGHHMPAFSRLLVIFFSRTLCPLSTAAVYPALAKENLFVPPIVLHRKRNSSSENHSALGSYVALATTANYAPASTLFQACLNGHS